MSKMNESILSEQILEDMKENRVDHMKYLDDIGSAGFRCR